MTMRKEIFKTLKVGEIIKKEEEHISKGRKASPQALLRMLYANIRMRDLWSSKPKGKRACLEEAIEAVKKEFGEFEPEYDENFFKE